MNHPDLSSDIATYNLTLTFLTSAAYVCAKPRYPVSACVDFSDRCTEALQADPDMCLKQPEFAVRMCPKSCSKCAA